MLSVASMFGVSLFLAMHGSLVTSFLVRKSTENDSQNRDYKLGQQEETYSILTTHGYFGHLTFQDPRLTETIIDAPAVAAQPTKRP